MKLRHCKLHSVAKKKTKNFFQMVLVVVITITFMLEIYPQIIELPRQRTEKR